MKGPGPLLQKYSTIDKNSDKNSRYGMLKRGSNASANPLRHSTSGQNIGEIDLHIGKNNKPLPPIEQTMIYSNAYTSSQKPMPLMKLSNSRNSVASS